jgi:hypothetical protein
LTLQQIKMTSHLTFNPDIYYQYQPHIQSSTRNDAIKLNFVRLRLCSVSEIRVLILTSEFIKKNSITFSKIRKKFPKFLPPNFYQSSRFV